MVRRIQALNYRCLRHVDVRVDGNFHILVGPNASGKSTLLDVLAFFADIKLGSIENVIRERVSDFQDLVWGRRGQFRHFELAMELDSELFSKDPATAVVRYELALQDDGDGPRIETLQGLVLPISSYEPRSISQFPDPLAPVRSILTAVQEQDNRFMFRGARTYNEYLDFLHAQLENIDGLEKTTEGVADDSMEGLGALKATLHFEMLARRITRLLLDGRKLRSASPPTDERTRLNSDGSNLPWVAQYLIEKNPAGFREWIDHVRIVLPELKNIRVVEREDNRHAHLMLSYGAGIEAPSWVLSEGTLRLLALTLIAYLPDVGKIYLIEEPENGIHPLAVEAVYQSLSSVYGSHVFVTTHSPALLGCAQPHEVLCFAKDREGATDVVSGTGHPRLDEWRRAADMDLLFAPDMLG